VIYTIRYSDVSHMLIYANAGYTGYAQWYHKLDYANTGYTMYILCHAVSKAVSTLLYPNTHAATCTRLSTYAHY